MTEVLSADAAGLARAARYLAGGALVAFPTETVYGLGGDARDSRAVAAIYTAKGRPSFNPLIVHVADLDAAERIAVFDAPARDLARRFWPGPLTLVLPVRAGAGISDLVTAGLETVAIRVPAHPVAQGLLRAFDGPVAAPSANLSGRVSPTRACHVVTELGGRIAAVVDGGACRVGVESSIMALDPPRLLRPGGVSREALEEALGQALPVGPAPAQAADSEALRPSAPGQLASHYAPAARVRLAATAAADDEIWIGFGPHSAKADLSLSPGGSLEEAAMNLFATLRAADQMAQERGLQKIAVAPLPETGLGLAVNDRLNRAAAPRE